MADHLEFLNCSSRETRQKGDQVRYHGEQAAAYAYNGLSIVRSASFMKEDEMNSSKDVIQMAAESVPRDVFRYTVEVVLDKASGETRRRHVARRAESDVVVWMKLNVPDGSRYVYALVEGMLATLGVTDIGAASTGGYDGDEWVVDASRIWIWKGPFLPDGVNPERPMMWAPSVPPNSTYADLNLARRIIEVVHPALVWWPDRRRPDAETGAVQPPRSKPHLIRYVGL